MEKKITPEMFIAQLIGGNPSDYKVLEVSYPPNQIYSLMRDMGRVEVKIKAKIGKITKKDRDEIENGGDWIKADNRDY